MIGFSMGVLFESSTPIEFLLKEALTKENIPFYEQYRIETGGRFSTVKYVADFLIVYGNVRLIVECDGYTYHSSLSKKRKQIERDAWLLKRHYKVLHFSTEEIKHKMPFVINAIKYKLGMIDRIPTYNTPKFCKQHFQDTYPVELICYYSQLPQGVCVSYIYEDKVREICSEIRHKKCMDVASGMAETTAIYLALLDLKKNVDVHVFYAGEVFNDRFDVNKTIRSKIVCLQGGSELLRKHQLCFTHINLRARQSGSWLKRYERMKTLKEDCLSSCKEIVNGKEFEGYAYQSLLCTPYQIQ